MSIIPNFVLFVSHLAAMILIAGTRTPCTVPRARFGCALIATKVAKSIEE